MLRTTDILFKDELAGTLSETAAGGARFTYAEGWSAAIACCFPATQRIYEWAPGLHPLFQHLGPEGWLRERQARAAHVVEDDDLGLLLRYGLDCIGAVSLRATGLLAWITEIIEATANPGRTVSGIQKKLLVTRDGADGSYHPASANGTAPYIAKFSSDRLPTLVRNEALSLRWASAVLGAGEVNSFTIAPVPAIGEMALIVTRFDRTANGEKLRLEDCAQILCKPRGSGNGGKYDAAYEDVATVIRKHSARPAIDLARFYRRLIAFALIGNCDAHLKNFSLLEAPEGLRLSPAYDVVNTAFYQGFDQSLALTIGGRKLHLDAADGAVFRDFGRSIGLSDSIIDRTFASFRLRARKAAPIIRPPDGEGPDGFVTRFSEIVSNACLRILGA